MGPAAVLAPEDPCRRRPRARPAARLAAPRAIAARARPPPRRTKEDGEKIKYVRDLGLPKGIGDQLIASTRDFAMRYWIIDNSLVRSLFERFSVEALAGL